MTEPSPLPTSDDLWDELLHSEISKQFLDKLIQLADQELKQQTR